MEHLAFENKAKENLKKLADKNLFCLNHINMIQRGSKNLKISKKKATIVFIIKKS